MNKLLSLLAASLFLLVSGSALAADPPKDAAAAKPAATAPQKPADVTAEAWAKMTDAEKVQAAEKAKAADQTKAAPAKKEKKGGC